MIFVTAAVSGVEQPGIRQGWVASMGSSAMIGETGTKYSVKEICCVVTNPPDAPSEEAQRAINSLK